MAKLDLSPELASRLLSPRLTALVTTVDEGGKPNIITLAWLMPTSFDPPLVAISVGLKRYSHALLEASKEFVINLPPPELLEEVKLCGSRSGKLSDKFAEAGLTPAPSKRVKPPRIEECLAHLECKLVGKLQTGDHTIFVGEVLTASAEERAFKLGPNVLDLEAFKPLLHLGGRHFCTPKRSID